MAFGADRCRYSAKCVFCTVRPRRGMCDRRWCLCRQFDWCSPWFVWNLVRDHRCLRECLERRGTRVSFRAERESNEKKVSKMTMDVIVLRLPAWFRSNPVGCVASITVRWAELWLTYPNRCDVDSKFPRTDTCVYSIPIQRIAIFFGRIWCQTVQTASKCPVLDRCFPSPDGRDSVSHSIHCQLHRFSAFYNQSELPTKQRCQTFNRIVSTEQIHFQWLNFTYISRSTLLFSV